MWQWGGGAWWGLLGLHVLSVAVWLGAQTRLIHGLRLPDEQVQARWGGRGGRWIRREMNVAMGLAFVFGGTLAAWAAWSLPAWPHWLSLKLGMVFALSWLHGLVFRQFRMALAGRPRVTAVRLWAWQALSVFLILGILALLGHKPGL